MAKAARDLEYADWRQLIVNEDSALQRILREAKRIVIVGIKEEARSWEAAHYIPRYLREAGYEIEGVNPGVDETLGIEVVDRLDQIEGPVDIVNVFRRPDFIPHHAAEALALEHQPRVFWMQLGIRHEESARDLAQSGIEVVQDRCILVEHRRLITRPKKG